MSLKLALKCVLSVFTVISGIMGVYICPPLTSCEDFTVCVLGLMCGRSVCVYYVCYYLLCVLLCFLCMHVFV